MRPPIELEYNDRGYLLLPASVAEEFFPAGTLVLQVRGEEMLLFPTRGPAAGGLFLKQRNPGGDRSLLAAPYLPAEVQPGSWPAFWDERAGALRVALLKARRAGPGIAAKAVVEKENGRWAVYLEVGFADLSVQRTRIGDYPSEQSALVAACWMERTADRELPGSSSYSSS